MALGYIGGAKERKAGSQCPVAEAETPVFAAAAALSLSLLAYGKHCTVDSTGVAVVTPARCGPSVAVLSVDPRC
jgi:hypothetical protein